MSRVFAVLVTYRRPGELRRMLDALAASDRCPDRLVVVDNDPSPAARAALERFPGSVEYVAAPENLGPAGGIALGMSRVLEGSAPDDWVLLLDDDDPPHDGLSLAGLVAFGDRMALEDPRTGGVGLVGARFDPRRGEMVRVPDAELTGPVSLDYLGGNQFPLYRVEAVRRIGPFREDLFFGFEELEFGLRMRRAGFTLYADGDEWNRWRSTWGRLGMAVRPATGLGEPSWRRYYGLRNLVAILRANGSTRGALRVTFVLGLAKPLRNVVRRPRLAAAHLALGWRASRDGWLGRMGRTVEPGVPVPVAHRTAPRTPAEHGLTGDRPPVKRVLLLVKGLGRGGAEQLLATAAPHLDRDRFDYRVAYLLPWKDALVKELAEAGLSAVCLDGARGGRWVARLRELVRAEGIDLVHTHSPYAAIGARLGLHRDVPFVHTEHNVWERYRVPTRWGNALTYPRNHHVFAVSDEVRRSIRYPRGLRWRRLPPAETLYHGVDRGVLGHWQPDGVRQELGIPVEAPVVGTVANFKAHKGHEYLLQAAGVVRASVPDARFVLVGVGPLEERVRRRTAELGLSDAVVFTGFREDVPRLLRSFDVFALPSIHEGLPISLLEAMAVGTPAVVTDAGGIGEVVRDDREAVVVPTRDSRALAAGLVSLLTDPGRRERLTRAAGERAGAFDIRTAVRRMESVYEELLA